MARASHPIALDALRSLPYAVGRLTSLLTEPLLDRLPGRDSLVPDAAGDVDAAHLERLVRTRHPEARVAAARMISTDAGTTERARIAVEWKTPPQAPGDPPTSLFVKCVPADFTTRYFVDLMSLGKNELEFYRSLRTRTGVAAPRFFAAETDASGRRFVLVLEDLAADAQCRFGDGRERLGLDETREALKSLARLHADFEGQPRRDPSLGWIKDPLTNPHAPLERFLSQVTFEPALKRYGDAFPDFVHVHGRRVLDARATLESIWAEGPVTVLHGDPHLGNMYLRTDPADPSRVPEVGLLDWQCVQIGQPMRDVTYALLNAADPDVVDLHEGSLVRDYLDALAEAGGTPPDFDTAYDQLRGHVFFVMIGVLVTAASATMQSRGVIEAAIRSLARALERTDPLGWLRARGLA